MKKIKNRTRVFEILVMSVTVLLAVIMMTIALMGGFSSAQKVVSAKADEVVALEADGKISESVDVGGLELLRVEYSIYTDFVSFDYRLESEDPNFNIFGSSSGVVLDCSTDGSISFGAYEAYSNSTEVKVFPFSYYDGYGYPATHVKYWCRADHLGMAGSMTELIYAQEGSCSVNNILSVFAMLVPTYILDCDKTNFTDEMLDSEACNERQSYNMSIRDFLLTELNGRSVTIYTEFYSGMTSVGYSIMCTNFSFSCKEYYSLPAAPVKDDYIFTGWYTDEACTKKYRLDYITEDVTLYAGFIPEYFTVTLNYGYDDFNSEVRVRNDGSAFDGSYEPRIGYEFLGWYYDSSLTEPYSDEVITSNITLYAKWEIKNVTVTYDYCFGVRSESEVISYGESAPIKDATRVGYNFLGWFTSNGYGKAYDNEAITSDTTLYAKWEIKTFKVTFIVDGEEYASVTVPYGSKFVEVSDAALLTGDVKSYSVTKAVTATNEALSTAPDGMEIVTDETIAEVELTVKTFDEKAEDFFTDVKDFAVKSWAWIKDHWVLLLCSFLGAGTLIAALIYFAKSRR